MDRFWIALVALLILLVLSISSIGAGVSATPLLILAAIIVLVGAAK